MMNRSASLMMSTSVLKALPGKLDIKRHSPSILYLPLSVSIDVGRGIRLCGKSLSISTSYELACKPITCCKLD